MTFLVVMKIFGKFAYLFVVSLLMGVAFGLVVALLLKKYNVSTYPQVSNLHTIHSYCLPRRMYLRGKICCNHRRQAIGTSAF